MNSPYFPGTPVLVLLLLSGVCTCLAERMPQDTDVIVTTQSGQVRGYESDGVHIFNGIPFAEPPVGDLRMKPPQPVKPWSGVKTTHIRGHTCPQFDLLRDVPVMMGAEDCLYLDVYVPATANASSSLPVMLWIYGGAFVLGDGFEFGWYDGRHLTQQHDVIIVTPNYRVGIFGYFAAEPLMRESGTTGNYGTQDQRLAMKWVQENIDAFGGDKDRVTIFGQSAGGISTCIHYASPASAGLFSRAIMESGNCGDKLLYSPLDRAYDFGRKFTAAFGCNETSTDSEFLSCVRGKRTDEIMDSIASWFNPQWPNTSLIHDWRASGRRDMLTSLEMSLMVGVGDAGKSSPYDPLGPVIPFTPTVDGTPEGLADYPQNVLAKGTYNTSIPFLFGTVRNEGSLFIGLSPVLQHGVSLPLNQTGFDNLLSKYWDVDTVHEAQALYTDVATLTLTAEKILRDVFFLCPSLTATAALQQYKTPIHTYQFTYPLRWPEYKSLGDYHTCELFFVWNNEWPPIWHNFNGTDRDLAHMMGTYWTNFAKTANPNMPAPVPVQWPDTNAMNHAHLNITGPSPSIATWPDIIQQRCKFWDANPCSKCVPPPPSREGVERTSDDSVHVRTGRRHRGQ